MQRKVRKKLSSIKEYNLKVKPFMISNENKSNVNAYLKTRKTYSKAIHYVYFILIIMLPNISI
jgi:hypothetical protein